MDKKLKDRVQEDVVQEQGPTDGTVIVSSIDNTMLSDESADQVMELFAEIGEIILVRSVKVQTSTIFILIIFLIKIFKCLKLGKITKNKVQRLVGSFVQKVNLIAVPSFIIADLSNMKYS